VTEKKISKRQRALNVALGNDLLKKGFKTKKGKGLKTALIDYICYELIINRNALDNRI
jgi:DNA-binding Xre family transcriptional regulator